MLALLVAAAVSVPAAEQAAIFKAAGFSRNAGVWKSHNCGDASGSYEGGRIDTYRDLNGDARTDAVVTEGSTDCYGLTGTHFWLVSKQPNGSWKPIYNETAMPEFLKTKGVGGWPDLSLGGPGFCFAVMRWNGKAYAFNRNEYEGKRCRP